MRNILATSSAKPRFAGLSLTSLALAGSFTVTTLWGAWATHKLIELDRREVVTVQLGRIMGDFIEGEARAGRQPEETRARVETFLRAVESSVRSLAREGRTVLVAEAVVTGTVPDLTNEVRADVASRLGIPAGAPSHGPH